LRLAPGGDEHLRQTRHPVISKHHASSCRQDLLERCKPSPTGTSEKQPGSPLRNQPQRWVKSDASARMSPLRSKRRYQMSRDWLEEHQIAFYFAAVVAAAIAGLSSAQFTG